MDTVTTIKQVINEAVEKVKTPTPIRLRDLIRQIRAARTAADERKVVNRECASIRASFRDEDAMWRCRNVAKLLYIHMLGYPAHFGQVECLKLVASSRYADKRVGYLGAMLLLDEKQDVHVLLTNSIKNDMSSSVQYIVSLALCTLGAIASPEMARDLAGEVERLVKCSSVYLRKKAAMCACKLIARVPDLVEIFLPSSRQLISEKNHGVLLGGVALIDKMCCLSVDTLNHFKKMAPNLIRLLKSLMNSGYSLEHDVSGVSDPFLQVRLLRLLRRLARDDPAITRLTADMLAQMATNTDTSKNVGNAILYETVLCILHTPCESGLRVLAVNVLGRFLMNGDRNIRYVGLHTLLDCVTQLELSSVQRHRCTILECLHETDITIRRRAMQLAFLLVNEQTVCHMSRELIRFIAQSDAQLKCVCAAKCVHMVSLFAPDCIWHVETLLAILQAAGNNVGDDVLTSCIQHVSHATSSHSPIIWLVWTCLRHNSSASQSANHQPLIKLCLWALGEFGDLIVSDTVQSVKAANLAINDSMHDAKLEEDEIINVYEDLISCNKLNSSTIEYIMTSLMKLSARFHKTSSFCKINSLVGRWSNDMNVELQQRSVEYTQLAGKYDTIKQSILERMPAFELSKSQSHSIDQFQSSNKLSNGDVSSKQIEKLSNLFDKNLVNNLDQNSTKDDSQTSDSTNYLINLLGISEDNCDELTVSAPSSAEQQSPAATRTHTMCVFETESMHVHFTLSRATDSHAAASTCQPHLPGTSAAHSCCCVTATITNRSADVQIREFLLQVAVPKTMQITMKPILTNHIAPLSKLTQDMVVFNPEKNELKFRLRISYELGFDKSKITTQKDVSDLPSFLYV